MLTLSQVESSVLPIAIQISLILVGALMSIVGTMVVALLKTVRDEVKDIGARVQKIEVRSSADQVTLRQAATKEYTEGRLKAQDDTLARMEGKLNKVCEVSSSMEQTVIATSIRVDQMATDLDSLKNSKQSRS